jgi:hypothetical protein
LSLRKIRQHYKSADAILNVCGAQEFNDDLLASDRILYVESDPGVEQIKVDQSIQSTIDYLRGHHALFTFGENVGTKEFPVPIHGLKWLSNATAELSPIFGEHDGHRHQRRFHFGRKLVDQRIERHHLARREISVEQIAGVHSFR